MRIGSCDCCVPGEGHLAPPRLGRRALLGGAGAVLAATALGRGRAFAADPVPKTALTSAQALQLMKDGNDNFQADRPVKAPTGGRARRLELALGQQPFCVLVGCSDSRVSPELLFERGLGELFIVRNAGNTVDTAALGSIEYGVGVLGCPLVVVLGHQNCGAVAAAIDVVEKNATFPGVIGEMVQPILPAVLSARAGGSGSLIDKSVTENAKRVAVRLKTQSPVIQEALRTDKVKVVAARYSLANGDVEWFEDL